MLTKNKISLLAVFVVFISMCYATLVYYPKWSGQQEKVISWDVAGYYQYLPAAFIYKDLKKVGYLEKMLETYRFAPYPDQVNPLPNGNRVMKYAMGQAVMFSPFFIGAHIYTLNSEFPADGFSTPYQLAIEFEILFFALLGLWFFRLILLKYFDDVIAAITILGIGLASNYFEYASITGAMTHNNLFALYTILIYCTIRFYERPNIFLSVVIGLTIGLMTLTRPTEMIAVLIPIGWGLTMPLAVGIKERIDQIRKYFIYYVIMAVLAVAVASLQLIYWKYVSGEWLVYSYGSEGFDWLSPHIEDCLISMRAGWLVYSPIMIFSLIGFYYLYRRYKSLFVVCLTMSIIAMYITFSWQTWWYGGSLGQRALIQYYPILAFPFAAFVGHMIKWRWTQFILGISFIIFIYYTMWLTHGVHKGGMIKVGQMTRAYLWKGVGHFEKNPDHEKLLDTDEYFSGIPQKRTAIYVNNFEGEQVPRCHYPPIQGANSFCMSRIDPASPEYSVALTNGRADWLRISAWFFSENRVWSKDNMAQLKVRFYIDDKLVKERMIRLHRHLKEAKATPIFFDVKCPKESFDRIGVQMNHGAIGNLVVFDDLKIETFNE